MIPGHKHLVFEEGLQSAWLYEKLSPHVDELVVAGITESRGPKSDKRDAYGLAEKLRVGSLDKPVFKAPRQFTRLRELSRIHMTLVGDVVRGQSRIKGIGPAPERRNADSTRPNLGKSSPILAESAALDQSPDFSQASGDLRSRASVTAPGERIARRAASPR